ncbi:hypothetical protein P3T23_000664 [Paraburkholderia sp. GAS448]|uniref:hypothetical protein n=1 Tax=Paraburkholderia sp. GAS448 TaxID=3035136 RepID=UPI003D214F54
MLAASEFAGEGAAEGLTACDTGIELTCAALLPAAVSSGPQAVNATVAVATSKAVSVEEMAYPVIGVSRASINSTMAGHWRLRRPLLGRSLHPYEEKIVKRLREGEYSFFVCFRKVRGKHNEINAPMANPIKSNSARPMTSTLDDNHDAR